MQLNSDTIFEAALKLTENERILLVSRLMDTIPGDEVCMSIDDPGLLDELDRRFSDGSETIPWSDLRAEG
jgi:putative addiction module component (TIGR02574 family)